MPDPIVPQWGRVSGAGSWVGLYFLDQICIECFVFDLAEKGLIQFDRKAKLVGINGRMPVQINLKSL